MYTHVVRIELQSDQPADVKHVVEGYVVEALNSMLPTCEVTAFDVDSTKYDEPTPTDNIPTLDLEFEPEEPTPPTKPTSDSGANLGDLLARVTKK